MKKCEKLNGLLKLSESTKNRYFNDIFTYSQGLILILKNTKNKRK